MGKNKIKEACKTYIFLAEIFFPIILSLVNEFPSFLRKEIFWSGSATVVVASLPDLSLIRYKNWTYVWYLPNRIIVITRLYKFGFFEFGPYQT